MGCSFRKQSSKPSNNASLTQPYATRPYGRPLPQRGANFTIFHADIFQQHSFYSIAASFSQRCHVQPDKTSLATITHHRKRVHRE
jgi:hypothetical protein